MRRARETIHIYCYNIDLLLYSFAVIWISGQKQYVLLPSRHATVVRHSCRSGVLHQYGINFYLSYLSRWPDLCSVQESPSGRMMGYGKPSSPLPPLLIADRTLRHLFSARTRIPYTYITQLSGRRRDMEQTGTATSRP